MLIDAGILILGMIVGVILEKCFRLAKTFQSKNGMPEKQREPYYYKPTGRI